MGKIRAPKRTETRTSKGAWIEVHLDVPDIIHAKILISPILIDNFLKTGDGTFETELIEIEHDLGKTGQVTALAKRKIS